MDRRTFLAGGLKGCAAIAATGLALDATTDLGAAEGAATGGQHGSDSGSPHPPTGLTTTGLAEPVCVDPDSVQFAWHLTDGRRGAVQSAYRIVVTGPGSASSDVWDSGEVASSRQASVAYAGPPLASDARYHWTVRTADSAGRWSGPSRPAAFATGLREADWTAAWLRPGPADPGVEEYTYLRTVRALPAGRLQRATAFVAAAHQYQLWVNGTKVDAGPSFCFPDEQYFQATDLSTVLLPGRRNVVGILHRWYGPGRGRPSSTPGLLVQVTAHYTSGEVVTLGSDGTWRSQRAEWLPAPQRNNDGGDFVEWIDGRLSPEGWSEDGFDDRRWTPATVLGPAGTAPFTHLYTQRTRITEHLVHPASVRTLPTGSVVVDFGKVYAGRPRVSFRQGMAGHAVPMHVGYTLDPDGSVSTTHNTQGTDLSFAYTQRAGDQTFEPYWYLGFRYLQIDDPGETIGAGGIALVARHAAMPDGSPATFVSSSRTLDAVWNLCAHSALYTSQEQFIDTPTREKGQFLWDAANESQVVMRTHGDQNLSWQGLRDMARAQARYWPSGQTNEVYPNDDGAQDYPTFTALYPEWVWRYYLSTIDEATTVALLPTLSRLSDYLTSAVDPSTGLVSGLTISTNGDNQYGYDYETTADTTMNVLSVNALRRIAAIAALAGDDAAASAQSARATSLAAAVNRRLARTDGVYVDGLRAGGQQSDHASQLANLSALAYGVVPADRVDRVAAYVASLDISVEPDHGMELLRALHVAGRDADVVRVLTDPTFPGWAAIVKSGGTFTWETWTPNDLVGDSMSHGWGSSALVAIQEAVLGVAPATPPSDGPFTLVSVTPPGGGVSHAAGTLPTPAGELSVSWRSSRSGRVLSLRIPPNAGAQCALSDAQLSQVTESGYPLERVPGVTTIRSEDGHVTFRVGAGQYRFVVAGPPSGMGQVPAGSSRTTLPSRSL